MILLVLSDEEGQQVLSHLLTSPLASVPVGRHPLSLRNVPWSEEERDVIRGCASALEARRAYRAAYPSSDRTDDAIARQYFGCTHPPKEETETLDEPAGPPDSENSPEEMEGPDLSRLDLTLDGLQDEDPAPPRECTGEEVTLSREPEPPEPKPEKKRKPRKDAWTPEEEAAIVGCTLRESALKAYREAFPDSSRRDSAVSTRWDKLRKVRREEERSSRSPALADVPPGTSVRVVDSKSPHRNAVATVVRRSSFSDEALVRFEGAGSVWFSRDQLEVIA